MAAGLYINIANLFLNRSYRLQRRRAEREKVVTCDVRDDHINVVVGSKCVYLCVCVFDDVCVCVCVCVCGAVAILEL